MEELGDFPRSSYNLDYAFDRTTGGGFSESILAN
jgi:hypothetical protein